MRVFKRVSYRFTDNSSLFNILYFPRMKFSLRACLAVDKYRTLEMIWKLQGTSGHTRTWEFATAHQPFEVKFNAASLSVRVSGSSKRLFFIEQFKLKPKTVSFISEYGHRVGLCDYAMAQQKGKIELHGHSFYFEQKGDVIQFLDNGLFSLTSCTIREAAEMPPIELTVLVFSHLWLYESMVEI